MEILKKYRELILYGLIGGCCATLDFIVYTCVLWVTKGDYLLFANCIGVVTGIIASFTLNRQYNFKVKDKTRQRFAIFFTIGMLGLLISSVMLYALVELSGFNELYAKLLTIVVVSLIQFILNKTITFKKENENKRKNLHCDAGI